MKTRKRLQPNIYKGEKPQFVELDDLRPHENVDPRRTACLKAEIERDDLLKLAIAVDIHTTVILDGHHWFEVLGKSDARESLLLSSVIRAH